MRAPSLKRVEKRNAATRPVILENYIWLCMYLILGNKITLSTREVLEGLESYTEFFDSRSNKLFLRIQKLRSISL